MKRTVFCIFLALNFPVFAEIDLPNQSKIPLRGSLGPNRKDAGNGRLSCSLVNETDRDWLVCVDESGEIVPKSVPEDVKKIVENWRQILGNFSNDLPIANALGRAKPSLDDAGNLMIKFEEGDLSSERIATEPGRSKVQQCLEDVTGKEIVFSVSVAQTEEEFHSGTIDLRDVIKMEIDEEDE